ncbi:hypothetical protein KKE60_06175 [Patescibacteria group bacterium]|nr:hypothetical protein [Patescibacteria group bacterium]
MVIPVVNEEEIREGMVRSTTATIDNLPVLEEELKNKIEEYKRTHGGKLDVEDDEFFEGDSIADLMGKVDYLKKLNK